MLRSTFVDATKNERGNQNHIQDAPSMMEFWDENSGIVGFDSDSNSDMSDDMLNDLSTTTLTYDEVHISVDEMSVLNDLHWRSIESSQRVDIAWDLIAEGCARYLIQAGTMPSSWTEYLDNELAQKRMYAPHFVIGRRPSLIKLCLIILPPPDVPNIISGGIVPFGGYPVSNNGVNQQHHFHNSHHNEHRGEGGGNGGLNVDHEIVSAVSKIVELSWYNYDESGTIDEEEDQPKKQEKEQRKKQKKDKKKKNNKKKKSNKGYKERDSQFLGHEMINYDGEGGGGVIGDAIEELLLRNIQVCFSPLCI